MNKPTTNIISHEDHGTLLRLRDVIKIVPVSKSTIWLWVTEKKFPKPVKLSNRVTVWRAIDIYEFLDRYK